MKGQGGAFYEDRVNIPRAVRSGTGSALGEWIRSGGSKGALVVLRVVSAGTSTVLIRIQSQEITEGSVYQLNQTVTLTQGVDLTTNGTFVVAIGDGVKLQPEGEGADTTHANVRQALAIPMPDQFRVNIGKGDTSAWEFGVTVRLV